MLLNRTHVRRWISLALFAVMLLTPVVSFAQTAKRSTAAKKPTAAEAAAFIKSAEAELADLNLKSARAAWVQSTYITDDTELIAADANEVITAASTRLAKEAKRYDGVKLPPDVARKLMLLKLYITIPAPDNKAEREETTRLTASLEGAYGKGKYCPDGPNAKCLSLGDLEKIMAESRDPEELKRAWTGWHAISPPYRKDYARFVELANKGARELGYRDVGALWRSGYDMTPDQFSAEMERLWLQVKPLYDSLYTYTRYKLAQKYGTKVVALDKPIPAHLLGNMWAQTWDNLYPILKPENSDIGYDLTKILVDRKTDYKQMVNYGQGFFMSMGMQKLPDTFWERSLFLKPQDHDVVCHASAWDLDQLQDVRLKMCIKIDEEDFTTIHHELGHLYYDLAYSKQPILFRGGANDGFHEAIGDTMALSVTPEYLKQLGLLNKVPPASADMGLLLHRALEKVAFLPFGYLVDQWRWKVFSGEISAADYNKGWWDLREKYQGIAPPVARSEADFDAGAKYHVPGNTPYARYFLADILQFQFHRALCREAGYTGPLHRCSIYGNKAAGEKFQAMLAMGQSRPWPEALKAVTGEEKMDATAIIDYFAPLKVWLDEQNVKLAREVR
jgi:peptidyl-dipeptidase A